MLNTCAVEESVKPLVIWLPIVCVLVAAAIAFGLYKSYQRIKKAIKAQEAYEEALGEKVEEALVKINELAFSMCFVSLANIKTMSGSMWSHEKTRDAGYLKFLDTYDELIEFVKTHPTVFFSHQWLAIDTPDPTGVHLRAIVDAAETLCTRDQIDPATLYCWIDYMVTAPPMRAPHPPPPTPCPPPPAPRARSTRPLHAPAPKPRPPSVCACCSRRLFSTTAPFAALRASPR